MHVAVMDIKFAISSHTGIAWDAETPKITMRASYRRPAENFK